MAAASHLASKSKKSIKNYMTFYLMALPGLAYLIINNYIPMAGLVVAFKNFSAKKGIWHSDWAGFKNFQYLFQTSDAWVITRNTILYNLGFILFGTVLSILVAVLLSEITSKKAEQFYQSAVLLPHLISMVIVSYLVFGFLSAESGFINKTILKFLGKDPISWYNEPKYWPVIITMTYLWNSVGYSCIIYLASIIGFDRGYYEAAEIEGAGKIKQVWYITLPLLKPTIIMMVMLAIGKIFYSDFSLFYQVPMNSGAVYPTTQTIDTYVYRGLLQQGNISMASAAGVYQSVVGFIVVFVSNLLVSKIDPENSLF